MKKINSNLTTSAKLGIYFMVTKKLLRGFFKSIFFKNIAFPFFVGRKVSITNKRNIVTDKNVKFEELAEIQGMSKNPLIFGKNVTIGRETLIRPSSYYGVGKVGEGVEIGDNSSIGPFGYIGCAGKIIIGKNVMIGPRVSMFAENHNFNEIDQNIKSQGVHSEGIVIEDNCWIGSGTIILDGVRIESGSVIGAGTIVSKNVSKNSITFDKREKITRER
ncbi:MAG: acyltransferase [Liquorilactobacillus ghanensis]|uniref:acyltransferase n=1 Tax=Liquorilactobacillus ghanensis TaxID=399370 RepID=UPI0039E8018D